LIFTTGNCVSRSSRAGKVVDRILFITVGEQATRASDIGTHYRGDLVVRGYASVAAGIRIPQGSRPWLPFFGEK